MIYLIVNWDNFLIKLNQASCPSRDFNFRYQSTKMDTILCIEVISRKSLCIASKSRMKPTSLTSSINITYYI